MQKSKKKTQISPEQLYKKNQKKAKVFQRLSPILFWGFMALFIIFFILTVKNSWGNITEIISLLDKKKFTGEQLSQNYQFLVEKWGEWVVIGGNGGFVNVRFIDIREAIFSGLMITFIILAVVCLILAIVLGKIIFPKLAQLYSNNNQDMVNIATLQTNAEIRKKNKEKEEEWF